MKGDSNQVNNTVNSSQAASNTTAKNSNTANRFADIDVGGEEWEIFMYFAFSHIDIRRKNPEGKGWL